MLLLESDVDRVKFVLDNESNIFAPYSTPAAILPALFVERLVTIRVDEASDDDESNKDKLK